MIYLSHATGFCKEVWAALVEDLGLLGDSTRAWDYPCHGAGPARDHPLDWWDMAHYALTQVEGDHPRLGVGHSMGAATLVMAQLLEPGTFDRLVLIEPIMFPGPSMRMVDNPMALAARRRSREFASREVAFENFTSKPVFSNWDQRAMAGYVEGGLRPEGDSFVLSCDPDDEAEVFETAGEHGAFARLGEIDIPVHVVAGEASNTHPAEFVDVMVEAFAEAESTIIPGTGHFVPMEKPGALAALIRADWELLTD